MIEKAYLKIQIFGWNSWKIIQINIKYWKLKLKWNYMSSIMCSLRTYPVKWFTLVFNKINWTALKKGILFKHCKNLYVPFPTPFDSSQKPKPNSQPHIPRSEDQRESILHFKTQKWQPFPSGTLQTEKTQQTQIVQGVSM